MAFWAERYKRSRRSRPQQLNGRPPAEPCRSASARRGRTPHSILTAVRRLTTLLFPLVAFHGSVAGAEEAVPTLTVKPVLCVTDRREEGCALSITVSWQSEHAGDFCLHSDRAEEPLRCWQGAAMGALAEELVIYETYTYWLTDRANARLAEATLELLTTESDDRRRNRRRRHVWDIL